MKYNQFIFERYDFNTVNKTLSLHYSLDGELQFLETYIFDFDYVDYDQDALDRTLQSVFFMAGVSYYKTYVPPEIVVKQGELDEQSAAFFSKTWQRGLGEFFYINNLDPNTLIVFPVNSPGITPVSSPHKGTLIGVGGGKDSLVSIEILRNSLPEVTTWALGHKQLLEPLVDRIGLPHVGVDRHWDRTLLELNNQGAMNGHVPISAIFACVGAVVAILSGKQDIVVSNEQSANEPTLAYQGVAINHQYSKSQEFERDFQAYLAHNFDDSLRYYSLLRPFSELYIGELFARIGFEKYNDVFSSCNRAFVHTSERMSWCGHCPKCAFVFMILTPFLPRESVEKIWGGKNLLLDPALEPLYRQLLGIEGDKPLECIGEIKESRAAMRLASEIYPELKEKYQFYLPDDYDYRTRSSDEMPEEIRAILLERIANL
jgi:UDP-N-acetyl-alpha-D-muramoyl-L-alanyl-L-glutamate epimerase